jgi:hypothetical protein
VCSVKRARGWHAPRLALAVGEHVEAPGDDLVEQLGAPAAAIEDDGDPALADEPAHRLQKRRQHLDHAGVRLDGHDEQRFTGGVVDPVVGRRRHRDAHARDVRRGDLALAVIDADVSVDVEEAHRVATRRDSARRQAAAELGRA